MTQQEQQTSLPSATRLRRSDVMLQILRRDKTPVAILLMAAVVGTLAGLIGVAFEKSVDWVQQQRLGGLAHVADYWIIVWPMAFIGSALLA
ncbi:MAG: ClC family H(+)/Cl(-) exchange transporter, partial [Enterobacterales bacterium]|nr:ClC family H(+)/Cl(-) exchange transporter [Enterobacterales bacterium]